MKAELFNKKTNKIVEDRNGDLCQLEEESVKPTVLREKQSFFYEQLYFDLNETDILESNCALQFKFWDYQDKYLGQLNYDLISKEGKLNLGEIFQQTVNIKGKKQKRKLRFLVEMKPFQLVLDEYSKKSSIQITMKKIGNYMDNYEMAYSFSFNKDSLILSDDYDFPIQYQSPEFFQPDNMRQISFNNIQMAVPINPNRMKLKYYNALFKLNIQFKFTVKVDSQKFVQELFAWYAHPLFNCVDKKFNTGIFDVQLFALPVVEENFYETRFQRIPVRFQFRIDVVNTDQIEALRQYEAKTTVFSNIIVSKPEEKAKEQFTIVIHCLKNTKKPYNINFGLLDPYYVEDDNGNLCNFEVDPETVDEEIQIVDYNCVTKIEINTREYAQRNIDNLQNNHLFFIMRDMKNKKQKVDYWVYIRLFDENMQFRYGDFIERVYVAPLVQPEDIDKQYNNLVLSDVEIHYSLGRYDKEQSFLEEKEYESETNSVIDEENSQQDSSYQNLLRNGQRLAYERQQNKNQSQTQSQSQYDSSNGITKTNLSELNNDEIIERQYGKFLQQKKEMGQKNQDSQENEYQEEDDTLTENQQKSQKSSNFTQSKSNLSDIRRYNYKGQVQDQINQSKQSQSESQNTSYYSNQSFIEKQRPKQFRNKEISAFQSLNPQNKNQYTNDQQAMEYNNDNFAEQYKNDGAISVPRNQFDQIRKNEIQRTIAQVGKYNYSSNYEPGQRNDKKNPIQNQNLTANNNNVVSSKNTSKYSLGSDIRDGLLKDFL
ncbi:hypothetical protein PPERSA_06449 [Pseudocohnilembus persalinus]|uniref:Uncharacterized protein n=1 Tax=Pseudocohnilembus persalinus TaxID=266149 RepID=A0A0V0QRA7_PSEPJ|nr:hypothetical protein PPERSA_06449 [Pseudocohnilembus persalinus]|eukprot:KRX04815.1 hypothetical protein PPERSA_06449 [Pseudocohnilembus persalinus]